MTLFQITVCEKNKGENSIIYKGKPLNYYLPPTTTPGQVITSKGIDAHLKKHKKPHKPAPDHPWRNYGYHISGKLIQEIIPHGND